MSEHHTESIGALSLVHQALTRAYKHDNRQRKGVCKLKHTIHASTKYMLERNKKKFEMKFFSYKITLLCLCIAPAEKKHLLFLSLAQNRLEHTSLQFYGQIISIFCLCSSIQ